MFVMDFLKHLSATIMSIGNIKYYKNVNVQSKCHIYYTWLANNMLVNTSLIYFAVNVLLKLLCNGIICDDAYNYLCFHPIKTFYLAIMHFMIIMNLINCSSYLFPVKCWSIGIASCILPAYLSVIKLDTVWRKSHITGWSICNNSHTTLLRPFV